MNSLHRWLKRKLWPWAARKFFRLDQIQNFVDVTDERYVDTALWARMRGLSEHEAELQLQAGVQLGYLEECFLYEWNDAPVRFLVPPGYIGQSIRLSDVGYIGEDDQEEIFVSKYHTRKVFIAATAEIG